MSRLTLFAGPSAHGLDLPGLLRRGDRVLPPVRRGDIDALLDRAGAPRRPAAIVVCDGVFEGEPAVSHAELCRALDAGWQVWGVSSLGAIRAWELRAEGMRGWGWVYAQFAVHAAAGGDFTDDEMCLLHFPEPPYFPVTEALVNLRYALAVKGPALGIPAAAAAAAIADLRPMWFGERTPARLRSALVDAAGIAPPVADALLAWLVRHRIKTGDLAALLAARPWAGRQARCSPGPA